MFFFASLRFCLFFKFSKTMKSKKGFTLFELIVAIAIVALIMGVVISRMDQYLELDMKKTSNRVASMVRYLYNKSVTEGVYLRLVFDLNEQTYWVEATRDPLLLSMRETASAKKKGEEEKKGKETRGKEKNEKEGAKPEAPKAQNPATAAASRLPKLEIKQPTFTQVESSLLKPTRLPETVFFKDIMTEHQPVPAEAGQATLNFFPNGYVEHAIINLRDEKDEVHYSLETNPITGQVKIENEYKTFEKR